MPQRGKTPSRHANNAPANAMLRSIHLFPLAWSLRACVGCGWHEVFFFLTDAFGLGPSALPVKITLPVQPQREWMIKAYRMSRREPKMKTKKAKDDDNPILPKFYSSFSPPKWTEEIASLNKNPSHAFLYASTSTLVTKEKGVP